MLTRLKATSLPDRTTAGRTAYRMAEASWAWGPGVVAALGDALGRDGKPPASRGFDIWNELPEWEERAPRPPAGSLPVSVAEAETRLAELAGPDAEDRPGPVAFSGGAAEASLLALIHT